MSPRHDKRHPVQFSREKARETGVMLSARHRPTAAARGERLCALPARLESGIISGAEQRNERIRRGPGGSRRIRRVACGKVRRSARLAGRRGVHHKDTKTRRKTAGRRTRMCVPGWSGFLFLLVSSCLCGESSSSSSPGTAHSDERGVTTSPRRRRGGRPFGCRSCSRR